MAVRAKNTYIDMGEYYIGTTAKGEEFLFDKDDYEKVICYGWYTAKGWIISEDRYIDTNGKRCRTWLLLSRLVMGLGHKDGLVVDHKNGNKLDNRKQNLRVCTQSENNMNKVTKRMKEGKVKGVYLHKRDQKWYVSIGHNKKQIHIGVFKTKEEAIKARLEAEEKYHGDYSVRNSRKGEFYAQ